MVGFRPCIDLHAGKVKQIVGSTLAADSKDDAPVTNFEASQDAAEFAATYARDGLVGGHVIMLGPGNEEAAMRALKAHPGGLQVGGGINPSNARKYLDAGASHVIVTSFVFRDGAIDFAALDELAKVVPREQLVLDLSCRRRPRGSGAATRTDAEEGESGASAGGTETVAAALATGAGHAAWEAAPFGGDEFVVVTDRWQKFTDFVVNKANVERLAGTCAEFLVHGVDVEGKKAGIEEDLVVALGRWSPIPVTYAGGVRSLEDLERVRSLGGGRVDVTVGSALDIFGGDLPYADVVAWHNSHARRDSSGAAGAAAD